jgi:hypothetical protein
LPASSQPLDVLAVLGPQRDLVSNLIEGLPKRKTDGFGLLANEAMAKAWPYKDLKDSSYPQAHEDDA